MHTHQLQFIVSVLAVVFFLSPAMSSSLPPLKLNPHQLTDPHSNEASSPFSAALQNLQTQIGYKFQNIGLLRRAMTHPSFSGENNRALSIFGLDVIETSIALRFLGRNIEIPGKDLNRKMTEMSKLDSCAVDAMRLGMEKVIRVSPKTNSSAPSVVCSAFRAVFGAISVDMNKTDDAGVVFWTVHTRRREEDAWM